MTAEWSGTEHREYCKLCKEGTHREIKLACAKGRAAISISSGLLVVCFVLSGISWSAKSDVSHQKEITTMIYENQKEMRKDIGTVVKFIELWKENRSRETKGNAENGK